MSWSSETTLFSVLLLSGRNLPERPAARFSVRLGNRRSASFDSHYFVFAGPDIAHARVIGA
ncbi:MAG: hypothetical protein AAB539_04720 [Patescibacteria group bacterium]